MHLKTFRILSEGVCICPVRLEENLWEETSILWALWHYGTIRSMGFPGGSQVNHQPANAENSRDVGLIPGSGRSPGVGNGNATPIFWPGKSYRQRSFHGGAESRTWLSTHTHACTHTHPSGWRARTENGEDLLHSRRAGQFHQGSAEPSPGCWKLTAVLWNVFLPLIHHPATFNVDLTLWLGSTGILHASPRQFPLPFWSQNCRSGHVPCTTNTIQECVNTVTYFRVFFFFLSVENRLMPQAKRKTKVCRKSGAISC